MLQLNMMAIVLAAQTVWRRSLRPALIQDAVIFPLIGFGGILLIWWLVSLTSEVLPNPLEAFNANLDFIAHPFYRRGPGDLGIGWLLLASLRRVFLGFMLGSLVAIPVGFLIGMSRQAMLAINPVIQIFKPVSPVAWLPVALAIFNLANPSAIFVIFITSLWPTI
ncbi:MAG TPA: nitrate ABC transporter, permease protein, partial [Allocoleopsis sp.]